MAETLWVVGAPPARPPPPPKGGGGETPGGPENLGGAPVLFYFSAGYKLFLGGRPRPPTPPRPISDCCRIHKH